jgi:small subunit ribosomal protein S9
MPKKNSKSQFIQAIGKRKAAAALVRVFPLIGQSKISVNGIIMKRGDLYVNKKQLTEAFSLEIYRKIITKPLYLTGTEKNYAISVHVKGGGIKGQVDAISHGISRALVLIDSQKYKQILKKNKLLTRDARVKERRKVGTGGKARRRKQSPKR